MRSPAERFSDRVANYVLYRPGYPDAVLDVFHEKMDWNARSVIADIGSGTGISAKLFLEQGNFVYGVEPNAPMRMAAEQFLEGFPNFRSIDGTAEMTTLPDKSVDFVVAAQACHWFDHAAAKIEFRRILRGDRWLVIIWNERSLDADDFHREYEAILKEFATDYDAIRHDRFDRAELERLFGTGFATASLPNSQIVDFQGLKGRTLSSSYMPAENDPRSLPLTVKLKALFDKCSENGRIMVLYQTNIFYARL